MVSPLKVFMKIVALCIDKENGMLFYDKRQSSDREVRKMICSMTDKIYVDEYTALQFVEPYLKEQLVVVEHPEAIKKGLAFIERSEIPEDADMIVIFKWDKKYPATTLFNFRLDGYRKVRKKKFRGFAHEKIEMSVYEKIWTPPKGEKI